MRLLLWWGFQMRAAEAGGQTAEWLPATTSRRASGRAAGGQRASLLKPRTGDSSLGESWGKPVGCRAGRDGQGQERGWPRAHCWAPACAVPLPCPGSWAALAPSEPGWEGSRGPWRASPQQAKDRRARSTGQARPSPWCPWWGAFHRHQTGLCPGLCPSQRPAPCSPGLGRAGSESGGQVSLRACGRRS